MRAFVAVELPESLRNEVVALQATLKTTGANITWVEPAHLHFTLKFLGNIEETRVERLQEALAAAARGHAPFPLQLEGVGAFPGTRNPRILWVGVTQGQGALAALAQAVEQACVSLRFPPEARPFAAHLTIGRIRSPERAAALITQLPAVAFPGGPPAPVNHLTLFRSTLSSRGPTYTPLAQIPLA